MRRTSPTCQRTLSKTPVAPKTTRNSRQQMGSVQWRSTFGPGFPRRCNKSSASAEEPQHLEQEAMAGWCTVSRDAVPLLCCGWCYGFSNFLTAGLKMAETAAVSIKVYSWCLDNAQQPSSHVWSDLWRNHLQNLAPASPRTCILMESCDSWSTTSTIRSSCEWGKFWC